jgi:spore germination protein GerM
MVAVVVFVFADQLLQGGSVAEAPLEASPMATTAADAFEPLPTASTPIATAEAVVIVSEPTATVADQAVAQAPTATFPPRPTARTVSTFTPSPVTTGAGGQATVTAGVATVVTTATVADASAGAAVATPLWLYFADASGTMYVPVYRSVPVVSKRVAGASLTALIDGPRAGMTRLILPETQLKSLVVRDGVAEVDFDRAPTAAGDIRGYVSIVHTLTQFGTVNRVKFFINGVEVPATGGIPSERIRINEWNPDDLSIDEATVLPLYFVSPDGRFDIPVSKLVPRTDQVAAATVNGLIKGAGIYADKVKQTIPSDTQLRGVTLQNGVAVVDLSTAFTAAGDRAGAMRTLVESLTSWPAITGVKVTIEGQSIAGAWGAEWDRVFERRTLNPES